MTPKKLAVALAAAGFASGAYATNGMNLEGYGPIAAGMGGASMAYDNGTAAVMNNPATLALAPEGARLDVAVGFLGPKVSSSAHGDSGGDAYVMPAIGWVKKSGGLSYGVTMFAQGGMGTEYKSSPIDGMPERSELGVGRLILPLAYNVTPDFNLGASLDFVWAMMDIKMAMGACDMRRMMQNPTGTFANGVAMDAFIGPAYPECIPGPYTAGRVDFSDDSDFTGRAKGYGFAGKLGFTYRLAPTITLGGTYHSKTSLGDMKTKSGGANMVMTDTANGTGMGGFLGYGEQVVLPGKITIHDFQWPETYALGIAIQATPSVMIAADVKRLGWKKVMKNFTMTYSTPGDGVMLEPSSAMFQMPQNWDDQNVYSLGVSFKATDALTLRAGLNVADNPIPDSTVHYLFPAIVKNHITLGFGYALSPLSEINFSLQHAPKVTQTNPDPNGDGDTSDAYKMSHSQTNWQLMYSGQF